MVQLSTYTACQRMLLTLLKLVSCSHPTTLPFRVFKACVVSRECDPQGGVVGRTCLTLSRTVPCAAALRISSWRSLCRCSICAYISSRIGPYLLATEHSCEDPILSKHVTK